MPTGTDGDARRHRVQYPRQVVQKTGRHTDVAALLQPGVPGQSDTRERGNLFASKPRCAPAAAALLFPQVYASIRVNFAAQDSRRAFGLLGMTLGLAAIAGQVLGGWMVHADLFGSGWRSIFLINVPIGLLAIVAARYLPESRAPQRPDLDWAGVALVSLGLALLLVPRIEGPGQGWPAWSFCALGLALALLALFKRQQEQRRATGNLPLVDMQLLAQRRFALGALLVLVVYSTSSSFFLCFALLMQSGLGLDPFMAGSIFAPCSVGFVLASLAAPLLVRAGEYVPSWQGHCCMRYRSGCSLPRCRRQARSW